MTTFGHWLHQKRTTARMSQQELGDLTGCSTNYISILERNLPNVKTGALPQPSRSKVESIAIALGVDASEALSAAGYAPTSGANLEDDTNREKQKRRKQTENEELLGAMFHTLQGILKEQEQQRLLLERLVRQQQQSKQNALPARVSAVLSALEIVLRSVETEEMEARLTALEKRLDQKQ